MPTEMELTLEQTQQGVSYEVSNIRVNSFTMKMEILLEPTSNKLMVERFYTSAGNPVKDILLKLNLPYHRIRKDGGEVKEFQRSFRHSDTERLSRSDEVLKLKNFKKDATLKLSKSTNQECAQDHISTYNKDKGTKLKPNQRLLQPIHKRKSRLNFVNGVTSIRVRC
ncbi:hypothetical protein Tco_0005261 [Tanacetum coccineum]